MGVRGKKRHRADGSIAGKPTQWHFGAGGPRSFDALEVVPTETLAAAVDICWRYRPSDGGPIGDGDLEDQFDEIHRLAEREGVDGVSLGTRADKLADLLSGPAGQALYTLDDDTLTVDPALLEHAATSAIDNSNKPIVWRPSEKE
jgi:hypothetical protein